MGNSLTHWTGKGVYFPCGTFPNERDWHNVGPQVDCPECLKLIAATSIQEVNTPHLNSKLDSQAGDVLSAQETVGGRPGSNPGASQDAETATGPGNESAGHSPGDARSLPQQSQSAPAASAQSSKDCKPCPQLDWCGAKGTTHCEHLHFAPGGKCPKATLGLDRDFLERTTQEARIKNQRSETTQTVTDPSKALVKAADEFAARHPNPTDDFVDSVRIPFHRAEAFIAGACWQAKQEAPALGKKDG